MSETTEQTTEQPKQSRWNLKERSEKTEYWGKVKRSYVGPASAEYQAKANGRAGDQWHLEIEPLWPFVYGNGGVRTRSQNMPMPGQAPSAGSPLTGRVDAFNTILAMNGLHEIESELDFSNIEGHIFFFVDETREFTSKGRKSEKKDDWPVAMNDNFTPPSPPTVLEARGDGEGSNASRPTMGMDDMYAKCVDLLDGKKITPGSELTFILSAGILDIQSNAEIMTLVNLGKLHEKLVEMGRGSFDSKTQVFSKAG